MAKEQTFKGRKVGTKSDDPGVAQRQKDAERTIREAEEGTGTRAEKGYAGSGDNANTENRNLDPDQSTKDQQNRQEAGKPINEEPEQPTE
jgi:hypothetical protein